MKSTTRFWLFLIAIAIGDFGILSGAIAIAQEDSKKSTSTTEELPAVLIMELTVNRPENARGYRKPYVAVWISDEDGFPVRTLALWVQKSQPGPRWIPDLRQWYQGDRMRKLVDETDLIDGISGATRTSGTYKLSWDGLDDLKQPLPAGSYKLNIEAAREHGSYQVIRTPLEHGAEKFERAIDGNIEIKSIKLDYGGIGG